MADAKKDGKKDDKGGKSAAPGIVWDEELILFIIIIIALIFAIVFAVSKYFGLGDPTSPEAYKGVSAGWESFKVAFAHFAVGAINTITFLSIFVSLMLIMAAYFSKFRSAEIVDELKYKDEQQMMEAMVGSGGRKTAVSSGAINLPGAMNVDGTAPLSVAPSAGQVQWRNIQRYMQSHNPSDWRLAILEADILLYDMLDQIGFQGDSIGEKLKSVDPASFNSLDNAWQAHKIRNLIAHEGANFELTYDESKKAINNYQKVFDEFYFI